MDILNWKTVHRASEQSLDELLALVKPYVKGSNGTLQFPDSYERAQASLKPFYDALRITKWEFCMCGEHEFTTPLAAEPECPECGAPRRDENGGRTTCTFTKYDLKDKLRALFSRPNYVAFFKWHANRTKPSDGIMHDVHGKF